MSQSTYDFTSESVSEGHPDKVSDRISDAIVDLFFRESVADGMSPWDVRVAAETLTTTNKVVIAGETRGSDKITKDMIIDVTRKAIKDIGYEQDGFHWKNADIDVLLHAQSADIAQGVDDGSGLHTQEGAGDQGIMFGYACNQTPALMPAPVHYSHKILQRLATARKAEGITQLGPDAKSQVTVRYENGKPVRASAIVLSTQHLDEGMSSQDVADLVKPYIYEVLPDGWITDETIWHINPTGKFVIGGAGWGCRIDRAQDHCRYLWRRSGLMAAALFLVKTRPKVDRSAAYAARYLAKNVVAAGIADWVNIQLSYAIGVANPTSVYVTPAARAMSVTPNWQQLYSKSWTYRPGAFASILG